jgi:hypothetical protein
VGVTGPSGPSADSGSFEYKDDSVIGRISIDVPAASLTDLDQVRQRATAIRTEQEAIARASGDWFGYLQQIPRIADQATQSYRQMITQLERISYIQQELGGLGNVGATGTAPSGGRAAPYSTAAPPGYADPFASAGGSGMGAGHPQGYMQSMMASNPALFANMAAQRGNYVNPATLGFMGSNAAANANTGIGGTGGGQGWGAAPPGSASPQETQKSRDAAAPPDQTQSGAPTTSEPQHIPTEPHPDSPTWQKQLASVSTTAADIVNETRGGMKKGVAAGGAALVGALSSRFGGGGGGDEPGAQGASAGGGGSGFGSILKGAGLAGAGITAALGANKIIQDAGSQIQGYRNLGAESGGGAVEGAGYEMQARTMAINPFLTLEQSRSIMQTALKNGYTGKEFDTVSKMMAENLKDMNMSSAQSMDMYTTIVEKGKVSVKGFSDEMDRMKDLTRTQGDKGTSLSTREQQTQDTTGALQGAGLSGPDLTKASDEITNAFATDKTLNMITPQAAQQALSDPAFMMRMSQANGVKGVFTPDMVIPRMKEQGIDVGNAYFKTLQQVAKQAQAGSGKDVTAGTAMFQMQCKAMGLQLGDVSQYRELYLRLISGGNPADDANAAAVKAAQDPGTMGQQIGRVGDNLATSLAPLPVLAQGAGDLLSGDFSGAWNSLKSVGSDIANYSPWASNPNTALAAAQAPPPAATGKGIQPGEPGYGTSSRVDGQVTGELRVTVDRDGNPHAPPTVQVSGQQQGVNAGYGAGTMNNPSPGDPSFNHANTNWSDGGSR